MSDQSPLHAAPSKSFTSPPLMPPLTEEKLTQLVSRIFENIKDRKDRQSAPLEPWASEHLSDTSFGMMQTDSTRTFSVG